MSAPQLSTRKLKRTRLASFALAFSLTVAGCATAPQKADVEPAPGDTSESVEAPAQPAGTPEASEEAAKDKPVGSQPDGQSAKQPGASAEMVTVSVYTIDAQCNEFVEESVQVPSDKAMSEAVGQAVNSVDYNAFKLDGYQVNVNGTTAVVDMQLAPGSERQFVSLSSCEQRALFGSVEETLLNNADWNVEAVKFTDSGKELVL